jgi:hypothetical protein
MEKDKGEGREERREWRAREGKTKESGKTIGVFSNGEW